MNLYRFMAPCFLLNLMPSLIQRFQALFRPTQPTEQPAVTIVSPPPRPLAQMRMFGVENDRRSIIQDCRTMYREDTRAKRIVRKLAKDAVKGGFTLTVDGPRAEEAQAIAEAMLERVGFWTHGDDWVRMTLRDGDSFFELGATAAGDIVSVSRKPTLEMYRWSDDFDQFYDPARAFFWTEQPVMLNQPPGDATFLAEWQVIHARSEHDEGSRYGTPIFESARKAYKRMTEGELDIAIRRKTRAGMKYIHALEDASEADIEAYKTRNKATLNDPFAAIADFFSNKKTSIQAIQGDANLADIADVEHHIATFLIASSVPASLIGYGQNLNRDVLDEQSSEYDEDKESLSDWTAEQIVIPLIERQWLLRGIWPEGLTWSLEWASKKALTPTAFAEAAKALAALRATGLLSDESLIRLFARFVPDFDAQAEIDRLAELNLDMVGRVADNGAVTS